MYGITDCLYFACQPLQSMIPSVPYGKRDIRTQLKFTVYISRIVVLNRNGTSRVLELHRSAKPPGSAKMAESVVHIVFLKIMFGSYFGFPGNEDGTVTSRSDLCHIYFCMIIPHTCIMHITLVQPSTHTSPHVGCISSLYYSLYQPL